MTPFERRLGRPPNRAQGVTLDRDLSAESLMELVKTYQGLYERAMRASPSRTDPKVAAGSQPVAGGVPLLGRSAARQLLPPAQRHPVSSWGTAVTVQIHGLRQHGRRLRHRRGLYPQPLHRGKEVLRRIF